MTILKLKIRELLDIECLQIFKNKICIYEGKVQAAACFTVFLLIPVAMVINDTWTENKITENVLLSLGENVILYIKGVHQNGPGCYHVQST